MKQAGTLGQAQKEMVSVKEVKATSFQKIQIFCHLLLRSRKWVRITIVQFHLLSRSFGNPVLCCQFCMRIDKFMQTQIQMFRTTHSLCILICKNFELSLSYQQQKVAEGRVSPPQAAGVSHQQITAAHGGMGHLGSSQQQQPAPQTNQINAHQQKDILQMLTQQNIQQQIQQQFQQQAKMKQQQQVREYNFIKTMS